MVSRSRRWTDECFEGHWILFERKAKNSLIQRDVFGDFAQLYGCFWCKRGMGLGCGGFS